MNRLFFWPLAFAGVLLWLAMCGHRPQSASTHLSEPIDDAR